MIQLLNFEGWRIIIPIFVAGLFLTIYRLGLISIGKWMDKKIKIRNEMEE